jgi:DNA invertase Pin-like site-specific DNA recombinase/transcriptional regulator with XRE-family HTH domain
MIRQSRCKEHTSGYRAGCEACRAYGRWYTSTRQKLLQQGKWESAVSTAAVLTHIRYLTNNGLDYKQIADRAGIDRASLDAIVKGRTHTTLAVTGQAILGVTLPPMRSRRGFIEATGTRRRLQALALAGWTAARVGQRLGVIQRNISRVRHGDIRRVRATFAASVAQLYDAEAGRPDLITRADREVPSGKAWLPARMWTPQTIDDPHANPLAPMAQPVGVRRRLQALAYIGQGPAQVGAWINESSAVVQEWTLGGVVPHYAAHLVDAVYRRWQATPGPDAQARQLAAARHWASALAWDGRDIDAVDARPQRSAKPPDPSEVEMANVLGALAGDVPKTDLTRAERIYVVNQLHQRGVSDQRIGSLLRWSSDEERGQAAVARFRTSHQIGRQGDLNQMTLNSLPQVNTNGDKKTRVGGMRLGYAYMTGRAMEDLPQLEALGQARCEEVIVEGPNERPDRPKLQAALNQLGRGDTLVIYKPDRIARSMRELLSLLNNHLYRREVNMVVLAGDFAGLHRPDGPTIGDKLLFQVAAMAAEMDKGGAAEGGQRSGVEARVSPRPGGRPAVMSEELIAAARVRHVRGESVTDIARQLGVGRSTLYRALRLTER